MSQMILIPGAPKAMSLGGKNGKIDTTHVWLTPKYILDALGHFDLDPCAAPDPRPWPTAAKHWTENGTGRDWLGRVWCNPPYGEVGYKFLARCVTHGNAVALVYARTGTPWFFDYIWRAANAVLFVEGKVNYLRADGSSAGSAPSYSCIVAYGTNNAVCLRQCDLPGAYVQLKHQDDR